MKLREKFVDDSIITLEKNDDMYFVKIDGDTYYKSTNEKFAVTRFNLLAGTGLTRPRFVYMKHYRKVTRNGKRKRSIYKRMGL